MESTGMDQCPFVYERIIGHPGGVSGCPVTVPMLSFGWGDQTYRSDNPPLVHGQ